MRDVMYRLSVTRGRFHQHFMSSFYTNRSQKRKETNGFTVFFAPPLKLYCKLLLWTIRMTEAEKVIGVRERMSERFVFCVTTDVYLFQEI